MYTITFYYTFRHNLIVAIDSGVLIISTYASFDYLCQRYISSYNFFIA